MGGESSRILSRLNRRGWVARRIGLHCSELASTAMRCQEGDKVIDEPQMTNWKKAAAIFDEASSRGAMAQYPAKVAYSC